MFDKSKETLSKDIDTIIGHSIKVKGDFQGLGNITIEGELEGTLKTGNNLLVGEKAVITADIEARDAKISGKIIGNLRIKNFIEVSKSASITGDISAALISIEKGAVIKGNCQISPQVTNHEK